MTRLASISWFSLWSWRSAFIIYLISSASLLASDPALHHPVQVDLRRYDLDRRKPVELNGEWEFYWDRFIPADTRKWPTPDTHIESQYWNGLELDGADVTAQGTATYRLQVLLPEERSTNHLCFLIRENNIASEYFVNGHSVGKVGQPSSDPGQEEGNWWPVPLPFRADRDTLDVVVHVSNHGFRSGGLGRPVLLGTADRVLASRDGLFHRDLLFIGLYFALAIYHLGIFVQRPKDRYSLWLCVIFLLWVGRLLFSTNFLISLYIDHIPWPLQMRLEYLSLYLVMSLTVLYFINRFQAFSYPYLSRMVWIGLGLFIASLLVPNTIFISQLARLFLYLIIPLSLLPLTAIIRAALGGKKDAQIILAGALLLAFAAINDTLYTLDILSTVILVPYAFFIFMFGQAYLVAKEYSDAFVDLEQEVGLRTQAELDLLNHQKHLEETVAERTHELAETNQQLEREIQEKTQREIELKASNDAKDKVFSIIAHDLRGPLGSQASFLKFINQDDTEINPEEIQEYLRIMEGTSRRLFTLLENLLSWSRLQLGLMQVSFTPLSLSEACSKAVDSARQQADLKNVRLNFDPVPEAHIRADATMLEIVIRNLLSNALKFSHRDSAVNIEITKRDASWTLSIADSGIGIPADHQDSLFRIDNKFRQTGTDNEASSGLGLLLVKEFTETNQGQVWFESREGEGTTFFVTFPAVAAAG